MEELEELEELELDFSNADSILLNLPTRRRERNRQTYDDNKVITFTDSNVLTTTSDHKPMKLDKEELIYQALNGSTTLNLKRCEITDDELISLIIELEKADESVKLEVIILTRNEITDRGAIALANSIAYSQWCKFLIAIDINQNAIDDEGASNLLRALHMRNSRICRLDVAWNGNITYDTKISIIDELLINISEHENVDELFVGGQALGDKGITHICNYLQDNTIIRSLFLRDNDIRTNGARSLLTLLKTNFTLTGIDLEENYDLELVLKEEISSLLVRNRSLGDLYLHRYIIDDGPPVHKSETSEVFFAKDVKITPPCLVALKRMKDLSHFERELVSRSNALERNIDLKDSVIEIIGWHAPLSTKIDNRFNDLRREVDNDYVLVMPRGSRSLWLSLGSELIAGYNVERALFIVKTIVTKIRYLHDAGLIHGDIKPRNILLLLDDKFLLCDLDASCRIGEYRPDNLKCSTAYSPPELARCTISNEKILVESSFDVWSIGVLLFELLSGRSLFSQDLSNDNMVGEKEFNRHCVWLCIDDLQLASVIPNHYMRSEARHLIRWCLQGNPSMRPKLSEILSHCLLGGDSLVPSDSTLESTVANPPEILEQNSARMKYHMFISHFQLEASGDVGTLYYLLDKLGISVWRDMNVSQLTVSSMRQGVYDSDVFVLFLTNAVLSRNFCLKEISWAIEFGKPIIMIVETEDRFWNWDFDRWTSDMCERAAGSLSTWTKGWLQVPFSSVYDNYRPVYELVKLYHKQNRLLPFRRRQFEVEALVREVVRISTKEWILPPQKKKLCNEISDEIISCYVIYTKVVENIQGKICSSLSSMSATIKFVSDMESATHIVILLTDGIFSQCSEDLNRLVQKHCKTIFVYFTEFGWNFRDFYSMPENPVKSFIAANEALPFRLLSYEYSALVTEVVRRLTL